MRFFRAGFTTHDALGISPRDRRTSPDSRGFRRIVESGHPKDSPPVLGRATMEYPPKIFARATWAGGLSDVSQISENWRLARAAYADLRLMRMPRVNLLLLGAEGVISNLIGLLQRHLDAPLVTWSPGQRLVLPPAGQGGTLILHEVG